MKNFLVIEDHPVTLFGLSTLIRQNLNVNVKGATSMDQALGLLRTEPFDFILMDINVPGGNSSNMIYQIRLKQETVKILVYSGYDEHIFAPSFLREGADGYISKNATEDQFLEAIHTINSSRKYISAELREILVQDYLFSEITGNGAIKLSRRETEIMQLLVQGKSTSDIGKLLKLKYSTVSTIKRHIFEKLQVDNVVDLAKKVGNSGGATP